MERGKAEGPASGSRSTTTQTLSASPSLTRPATPCKSRAHRVEVGLKDSAPARSGPPPSLPCRPARAGADLRDARRGEVEDRADQRGLLDGPASVAASTASRTRSALHRDEERYGLHVVVHEPQERARSRRLIASS